MSLEPLYQMLGTQPSVQALTQILPSLMQAIQNPMSAIEGYMHWANNQNKGETSVNYLDMAQKAIEDVMNSLRIINGNMKGLYDEMEVIKQTQAEIMAQQKEIMEALKEVE